MSSETTETWGQVVDGVLGGAASYLSQAAGSAAPAVLMLLGLLREQLKELIDPDETIVLSSPKPVVFEDLRAKKEDEEEED